MTRTIVFDMDGTLVQTRAASWEVFQDTARQFDLPVRSAEDFFELFRENFYDSLRRMCPDSAVEAAVREHFLQGLRERYSPRFIPGMVDVVKGLASRFPLAVMSSNAMVAIRRILEAEDVAQCFAHVFSGEVGASKEAHLRRLLADPSYGDARHCSPAYVEAAVTAESQVVLVTDTVGDVREARRSGARVIGVAWGMHSIDALLQAGAESVALWPQELLTTLLPDGPAPAGACACASAGSCSVGTKAPASAASERARGAPAPGGDPEVGRPWRAHATAASAVRRVRAPRPVPAVAVPAVPGPVGQRPRPRDGQRGDPVLLAALSRISQPP